MSIRIKQILETIKSLKHCLRSNEFKARLIVTRFTSTRSTYNTKDFKDLKNCKSRFDNKELSHRNNIIMSEKRSQSYTENLETKIIRQKGNLNL